MAGLGRAGWVAGLIGACLTAAAAVGAAGSPLWVHYQGTAPELRVTFEYPAGWRLQEERGRQDAYVEARLLGPRNAAGTYTAMMVVRSVPAGQAWTPEDGVEELVARLTDRTFDQPAVDSRRVMGAPGRLVREVQVSYTIPALHSAGLSGEPIPGRVWALFMESQGFVYEISYSAEAGEFPVYARLFEELLETFTVAGPRASTAGPGCAGLMAATPTTDLLR